MRDFVPESQWGLEHFVASTHLDGSTKFILNDVLKGDPVLIYEAEEHEEIDEDYPESDSSSQLETDEENGSSDGENPMNSEFDN